MNLVEEQRRKQQRSNYCICGGAKMQHYLGKKIHQPRGQRTVNKLLEETTEGWKMWSRTKPTFAKANSNYPPLPAWELRYDPTGWKMRLRLHCYSWGHPIYTIVVICIGSKAHRVGLDDHWTDDVLTARSSPQPLPGEAGRRVLSHQPWWWWQDVLKCTQLALITHF